jgi:hypothetical protein
VALGRCGGSGPAMGRRKWAEPKVTGLFSIYSNIFKRLELIGSKGVLPKFKNLK